MFRNFIKVAFRNLSKNKGYVLINTFGMGIALTCCLAAYLLVAYDLEFDNYFQESKVRNITKVMHHLRQPDGEPYQQLVAPIVMAPLAAQQIAGIKRYTRYCNERGYMSYGEEAFAENIFFADSAFFDMFELGFKSGSALNFRGLNTIFISERLAHKYFGEDDPVGRSMEIEMRNKKFTVQVGGVMEKLPLNTSFNHDALMRIDNYLQLYDIRADNWAQEQDVSILFELADIGQLPAINRQLNRYVPIRNGARTDVKSLAFEAVPFSVAYSPNEVRQSYLHLRIPFKALVIFITLGFIILLIACFNLTNTTLALTLKRLKEIGIRKVAGSTRWQIVSQFLLEMVLTVVLAVIAGFVMAQVVVPEFAAMWGLQYGMRDLNGLNLLLTLILLLFVSALLAGIYPALLNSRFSPVVLMKGATRIKGTNPLTRVLLVIQFSLSVIVLIAGIVFTLNAGYQRKISFGYDKEKVVVVSIQGVQEYERLKNAVENNPEVEGVAVTNNHLGYSNSFPHTVKINGEEFNSNIYEVGAGYFKTMGLNHVVGRDFRESSEADLQAAAIVDENFVSKYHLTQPLGTVITYEGQAYQVIGVVKNHLSSFFDKGSPSKDHFYRMAKPQQYNVMVVRTDAGKIVQTQKYLEQQWKKNFPGQPFQSELQEQIVFRGANEYNKNLQHVFLFLTVLSCILSTSGIYSLARLNVQRRTKEIGVRKVLGASLRDIVQLVNREFVMILGLSVFLGGTGGFVLTKSMLSDLYVQHIPVGMVPVVLCSLLVFLIGLSTTSIIIMRAARVSPVLTLKTQ
jgi:ABC-type antimicrobial peptide transport system permease subunit